MASNNKDVIVKIGGDAKGLDAVTAGASRTIGKFAGDTRKAFSGLGGQIFSLRGALTGIAAGFSLRSVINATVEAERIQALLEAKLKSTGRTAEFTGKQLADMGDKLREGTTFDDEGLAQAQTSLLTFGRVTGKTFEDATRASLDLSTALGTDLNSAAELVGRALQQPDKAAKQLRSANILLTKSEEEKIKKLVEGGKVAEAQAIVLGKLETAYGGAAKAAGDTFGGAIAELKNNIGNLLEGEGGSLEGAKQGVQELSATLASPQVKQAFGTLTSGLLTAIGWLAQFVVKTTEAAQAFGVFVAKLNINTSTLDKLRLAGQLLNPVTSGFAVREIFRRGRQPGPADEPAGAPEVAAGPSATGTPPPPLAGGAGGSGDDEDEDTQTDAQARKAATAARQRAQAAAAAEAAVFKAAQERQQASLEALHAQNLISLQDYHAQKLQLELTAIDQEIAARRESLKTADEAERIRARGEIEALSIQRTAAIEASAREQAEAEKKLGEERLALEQRLLEATGRGAEARAQAIEQEFAQLIARLKAQGDTAGVEIAVQLKGVELARAQFEALENELSQAQDGYQRRLQEIDTAVQTGASTRSRARRDQVAAAQALVVEEERIADAMQVQADIVGDPALLGRVRDLRQEIVITGQVVDETMNQIRGLTEDALGGLFEEILDDPKNFADAVDNALLSVERSIQRLIAQRLSEQLVDSLFGGVGGGAGGGGGGILGQIVGAGLSFLGGGMSSSGVKELHAGGLAGTGRTRSVPALTIADAPRYHAGGLAGLGPDEVPAILKTGRDVEEVVRRDDPRHRLNGGLMPMSVVVNISTPDAASFRRNLTEIQAQIGDAVRRGQRNR